MITTKQIQEILSLYSKYDWKLRRVLLTDRLKNSISDLETVFKDADILTADIDAVWFSRPSGKDNESWELRRLSETPFALIEVFSSEDEEETREEVRRDMEAKLG